MGLTAYDNGWVHKNDNGPLTCRSSTVKPAASHFLELKG